MAMSLSIDSRLASSLPASSASSSSASSTPITTLAFPRCLLPRAPSLLKPILVFPLSHASSFTIIGKNRHRRPASRIFTSAGDSGPTSSHEEEGYHKDAKVSKAEADKKYPSDLKALIRIYKEALSQGDDKTASEIESVIRSIEMKKNELDLKVLTLSGEIASGKEKYIRLQADFDNFRKRFEKDRAKIQSNARGEMMESLLPMIDSFESTRKQMKPGTEKETKIDTSYQGIYKQFVEIMRSLNVSVIATVGKPFDPSLHIAVAREESQKFKEGIIIEELRRGFLLGDKILRPAKVKVSAGAGSNKAPASSEQPATAAGVEER